MKNKRSVLTIVASAMLASGFLVQDINGTIEKRDIDNAAISRDTANTEADSVFIPPLVVQVLGTPASGKSMVLNKMQGYFNTRTQMAVQILKNVDLDDIREAFNKLDSKTKFYVVVRALDLFSRTKNNTKFNWIEWESSELMRLFNESFKDFDLAYSLDEGLRNKGKKISVEDVINEHTVDEFDEIFKKFDPFQLGNIVNRYYVLNAFMESLLLKEGLRLDDAGAWPGEILHRLKVLRDDRFLTLSIVVHPKTVLVNLLLSSLRGVKGNHYAPAKFILDKYNAVEEQLNTYSEASEEELILLNDSEYAKLGEFTARMTIDDNGMEGRADKKMDAIIIDRTQSLRNALKIVDDYANEDTEKRENVLSLWRVSIAQLLSNEADNKTFGRVITDIEEKNADGLSANEINEKEFNSVKKEFFPEGFVDSDPPRIAKLMEENIYVKNALKEVNIQESLRKLKEVLDKKPIEDR